MKRSLRAVVVAVGVLLLPVSVAQPARAAASFEPPRVTPPVPQYVVGSTAPSAGFDQRIRLTWKPRPGTNPVCSFDVYHDSGRVGTTTRPFWDMTVAVGPSHGFAVIPVDCKGNSGPISVSPVLLFGTVDSANLLGRTSGTGWRTTTSSTSINGSRLATPVLGDSLERTQDFWSRFAWVAQKSPTGGKANVYVDGRLVRTVDLYATKALPRRVVFSTTSYWGAHSVKIVVVSPDPARPWVNVDALYFTGQV